MKLTITAFGIARDIIGGSSLVYEIPADSTVEQLMNALKADYPKFNELRSLMVAINSEYAKPEQLIAEADEIVLIPPVAGG